MQLSFGGVLGSISEYSGFSVIFSSGDGRSIYAFKEKLNHKLAVVNLMEMFFFTCMVVSGVLVLAFLGCGVVNAVVFGSGVLLLGGFSFETFLCCGVALFILTVSALGCHFSSVCKKGLLLQREMVEDRLRGEFAESIVSEASERMDIRAEKLMGEGLEEAFFSCDYVKKDVKKRALESEDKRFLLHPLLISKTIAKQKFRWPLLFNVEGLFRDDIWFGVSYRCKTVLPLVFLGFFRYFEVEDVVCMYDKEIERLGEDSFEFYELLFAKCIRKYPQIVAAEAAYFSWLRNSYPHVFLDQSAPFRTALSYKRLFFTSLKDFVEEVSTFRKRDAVLLLAKLSGWAPVSLASLDSEGFKEGIEEQFVSWDTFCRRVSEFCYRSISYDNVYGDWDFFLDFVDRGYSSSFLLGKEAVLKFEEAETDFFDAPQMIWNMKKFCERDKELRAKIEEGLGMLSDCGYLGGIPIEELQVFERFILGL
ncbi:hypothetical protein [Chlamydiifrater volucris]|uniref:hypothetical protein n=1 Tax=Chlamydiifrater volucris TaxID=2681470 RepID=UPI001BCB544A|nr:hypothetical protein [Chlamydiifrater volucris]